MKQIIRLTPYQSQLKQKKREAGMVASIHPVKFINSVECSPDYVEEFDFSYAPIYAGSPLVRPPFSNTGGIEKPVLETATCSLTPPTIKFNCIVDYLSITFNLSAYMPSELDNIIKIQNFIEQLTMYYPGLTYAPLNKGLFGYKQSMAFVRNGGGCGLMGFDGNNDSCYVSFSGQGCVGVDMGKLRVFYQSLPGCKITRIDLAHDDLQCKNTIHDYKKMALRGDFAIKGVAPSTRFIDDMGSDLGCTLYVGRKKNGNEACIYEKGKQLGDKLSKWLRFEGRITAVDRVVPFEAMTQPADYLAALYPPFAHFSSTHQYIEILREASNIALDNLMDYASIAYGKLFWYLREVKKLTDSQIVQKLVRDGVPKRLQVTETSYSNLCPF